jgi:murein DD-endopeptidase MepM/ murein hydrolase activator NlpD
MAIQSTCPLLALAALAGLPMLLSRSSTSMPSQARASCPGLQVEVEPEIAVQGSLVQVRLQGVPNEAQLAGRLAGEALHFAPDRGGVVSLGALPVDADSAILHVHCVIGGEADSVAIPVRVARAGYAVERLRVAPGFATPPDSALAARIARESKRALDASRLSHATPRLWSEPFLLPRASRITSEFGRGREYNGTLTSRHMGTDFAGATGSPVRAANRGVARIVDSFFYGGNVVYLDHGDGLVTAYLHLSRHRVAEGDTVERGALVGDVGATGRVTGPHLHLITRYGTLSVDPLSLFRLAGDSAAMDLALRGQKAGAR